MRTTITLDPDVATRLSAVQQEQGLSFKEALNQTLRRGLGAGDAPRAYRMPTRALGVRPGIDIDRIRDVLGDLDDARFLEARKGAE